MSGNDFVVRPRSWDDIQRIADDLRAQFGLTNEPYFPVMEFVEGVLDNSLHCTTFLVGEHEFMEGAEGLTDPGGKFIMLRQDVYQSACRKDGRARFTAAHELGHWIMHTNVPFARIKSDQHVGAYRRTEPQANQFAAELLMPRDFITWADDEETIMARHGVSHDAARIRLAYLRKKGTI